MLDVHFALIDELWFFDFLFKMFMQSIMWNIWYQQLTSLFGVCCPLLLQHESAITQFVNPSFPSGFHIPHLFGLWACRVEGDYPWAAEEVWVFFHWHNMNRTTTHFWSFYHHVVPQCQYRPPILPSTDKLRVEVHVFVHWLLWKPLDLLILIELICFFFIIYCLYHF